MKGTQGKAPAFQFYVKDWLSDPQLRSARVSTRGIWIDVLCFMWEAPERGLLITTMEKLARMTGCFLDEIKLFFDDANELGFCDISVTDNKKVTICNRRMYREERNRKNNRLRQQRFREKRGDNAFITPPSSTPTPTALQKKEKILKEKSGEKTPSSAKKKTRKKFIKPTIDQVKEFCLERKNGLDPEHWHSHYESNGWVVGRGNKMKCWKSAVITWEKNGINRKTNTQPKATTERQRRQAERTALAKLVLEDDKNEQTNFEASTEIANQTIPALPSV